MSVDALHKVETEDNIYNKPTELFPTTKQTL
jgi:hypothetical protein